METYSVINDFGGIPPNQSQLSDEIISQTSIVKTLIWIETILDNVNINFDSSLSGPEKVLLDVIVGSHVPIYVPTTVNKLIISGKINSKNSTFTRVGTEIFKGSAYATAKAISYMDSSVSSYDIQIFDKTNKQILLTANLTNTSETILDLGVLSNLPTSSSQIEVSIKKNGGNSNSKVYIESVTIYYN